MTKRKIQLCIELEVEFDGTEEQAQFYFEEHRCRDDFVEQAAREVAEATTRGTCLCYRSSVTYLGPAEA